MRRRQNGEWEGSGFRAGGEKERGVGREGALGWGGVGGGGEGRRGHERGEGGGLR